MKKLVLFAVALVAMTASVSFVSCNNAAPATDTIAADTVEASCDTLCADTCCADTVVADSVAE